VLFLTDLDPDAVGDAGAHATHYEPVDVADFHALLACIPLQAIERSTFVDVGAGMGRALLLASSYPFKQIVGVEVSAGLCEVAHENLERIKDRACGCNDLRLVRADARIWQYPPGELVVFMFNPFDGHAMRASLGSILGRPRAGVTWLLYHTPAERAAIEADESWDLHAEIPSGIVYRSAGSVTRFETKDG
jgi:SAM-dependent methyltransferase